MSFIVNTLLLWDIDGTLIDSGGAGERALRISLQRRFGICDSLAWLEWAGRTDLWIARQILQHHELPVCKETVDRFLDGYLEAVGEEMNNPHARVLPGVREMLEHVLSCGHTAQGLLTGNLERGAKIKLGHFDLWKYFAFGAYADDSEVRDELGPFALRRAHDHHRILFHAERVWVIGDTPHDIACGRALGARTVAVATGKYTVERLRPFGPDLLLPDLQNWKELAAQLAREIA